MLDFVKEEYESLKQRIALKQNYQVAFESPAGQRVLRDIIRRSGMFSTSVGKDANPHETAYREGKRAMCLEILSMMRMTNETAMLKLLQERENGENQ